jgi:hypothetical protein
VHQLEAGRTQHRPATLRAIRRAFERAGVEFTEKDGEGEGVRLRPSRRPRGRKGSLPTGKSLPKSR